MTPAFHKQAEYVLDLCARIAAHTDLHGTITRTFLSPATHAVHALLRAEMQSLGMSVRTDSAGNLRGTYPAANLLSSRSAAEGSAVALPPPVLLTGSHIDTVPNAGPYDGILGVAIPIALIRSLNGARLPCAIEVIAFSEEEGVRFKLPFIGSRALIGDLTPADLARTDPEGITLAQAIRNFGLNPDNIADALLTPGTFAFFETHIEQGPVLESLSLPHGVVTTIAGQSRFEIAFLGQANHAGTTPMHLRRDALAGAAEFICAVSSIATQTSDLVATVGTIHALPGAPNIIPDKVTLSLDIRHPDDATRLGAARELLDQAGRIASAHRLELHHRETSQQPSTAMDAHLLDLLSRAAESAGHPSHAMPSGAGHDAMILARKLPSAMLFLRTPGGLSHHPNESVLPEDIEAALAICLRFLNALASEIYPDFSPDISTLKASGL